MLTTTPTKLSNLQLHLLKMYSHDISESDLNAIQKILAKDIGKIFFITSS
jgi:hypothetical protein